MRHGGGAREGPSRTKEDARLRPRDRPVRPDWAPDLCFAVVHPWVVQWTCFLSSAHLCCGRPLSPRPARLPCWWARDAAMSPCGTSQPPRRVDSVGVTRGCHATGTHAGRHTHMGSLRLQQIPSLLQHYCSRAACPAATLRWGAASGVGGRAGTKWISSRRRWR